MTSFGLHRFIQISKADFCIVLLVSCVLLCFSIITVADDKKDRQPKGVSMGTGWPVTSKHVVTNFHVVRDGDQFELITTDKRKIPAKLLIRDAVNDLAILEVTSEDELPPALPLAKSRPKIGAQTFTIGFPYPDLMGTAPKLTTGFINSLSGLRDDPRTYQISVPVQPGNSGGPLLNMNGEVIGIVTSKLNAMLMFKWTGDVTQNVNYAVKVNYLDVLLDTIRHPDTNFKVLPNLKGDIEQLANRLLDSIVIVAAKTSDRQLTGTTKQVSLADIKDGKLSPDNIRGLFSNRTARGYHHLKKFSFSRFFAADGTLTGNHERKGKRTGSWSVSTEGLCVDLGKGSRCREIVKENGKIYKYVTKGNGNRVKAITYQEFLDGNPDKL